MSAYNPPAYPQANAESATVSVAPFSPIGPIGPAKTGPQIYVQNTAPFGTIATNSLWFDTSVALY